MKNTIWNTSCSTEALLVTAMIANTIDAAPRSPAADTKICCDILLQKGVSSKNTATGLAIKVKNIATANPIPATWNNCDGNDKSPNRKNKSICINPVSYTHLDVYKRQS